MMRSLLLVLCLSLCLPWASARDTSVRASGAVGDGQTDDTAAFQQAIDLAHDSGGGIVAVPGGTYAIRGNLRIPYGVTLQGTFRTPPNNFETGSVLLAYAGRGSREGQPFIHLNGFMATVEGLIIKYPEVTTDDVPPVPYPPCIKGSGASNMGVLNCCLVNPYEALHFVNAGRHFIQNVYGYPIKRGYYVDANYDVSRIENCHFWPFGVHYKPGTPYCEWININGVAFEFARTDWHYTFNTFCFGYGAGYKFSAVDGRGGNGNYVGLGADCCRRAVLVEAVQKAGLQITNGEFVGRWTSKDSITLEITDAPAVNGKVTLNNCTFWGPIDRCIWQRSPNAQVTANACNFLSWDINGNHQPAIHLAAGKAIIQGNTFQRDRLHILVENAVASAIIMANQGNGGLWVENEAGRSCQIYGNEQPKVSFTQQDKLYYRFDLGAADDGRYLRNFHDSEPTTRWPDDDTKRWTRGQSQLVLPVVPGREYTFAIEAYAPSYALAPAAGVYLHKKQLASIDVYDATATLTGTIPPQNSEQVQLEIICQGWEPAAEIEGSEDGRELGLSLASITLQATGLDETTPLYHPNAEQ